MLGWIAGDWSMRSDDHWKGASGYLAAWEANGLWDGASDGGFWDGCWNMGLIQKLTES